MAPIATRANRRGYYPEQALSLNNAVSYVLWNDAPSNGSTGPPGWTTAATSSEQGTGEVSGSILPRWRWCVRGLGRDMSRMWTLPDRKGWKCRTDGQERSRSDLAGDCPESTGSRNVGRHDPCRGYSGSVESGRSRFWCLGIGLDVRASVVRSSIGFAAGSPDHPCRAR